MSGTRTRFVPPPDRPLRVLFDGFWWVSGPTSNRQVLREFILAWLQEFPDDAVTVAVRRRDLPAARRELPPEVQLAATRLAPQGISAITELPLLARRLRVDVTVTHNFTPAFGRAAVFIHDYMFLTSPEWFTRAELAYFRLMPLTAPRARWLFTSSGSEAARISRLSRGRPVTPVGLAVGRALAEAEPCRPAELDGVDRFLLCVGRLNARKNLAVAIQGALASGRVAPDAPLLIVGEPQGKTAQLPGDIARAVDDGSVRFLGFIDDGALAWLYRHADALLFLSRDEGFGMPALEALHFGAPVLASDIPVFREILGRHGSYAPPDDVAAVADELRRLPARGAPVDVAALGYSWQASARALRATITGARPEGVPAAPSERALPAEPRAGSAH